MTLGKGLCCPNCGCSFTLSAELREPNLSELTGVEYVKSYTAYLKQKIADKLTIPVEVIDINTNKTESVVGRWFLFALMHRKFPLLTLNALAACIGTWQPNHATVFYALRKIEDMATNPTRKQYAEAYRQLECELFPTAVELRPEATP